LLTFIHLYHDFFNLLKNSSTFVQICPPMFIFAHHFITWTSTKILMQRKRRKIVEYCSALSPGSIHSQSLLRVCYLAVQMPIGQPFRVVRLSTTWTWDPYLWTDPPLRRSSQSGMKGRWGSTLKAFFMHSRPLRFTLTHSSPPLVFREEEHEKNFFWIKYFKGNHWEKKRNQNEEKKVPRWGKIKSEKKKRLIVIIFVQLHWNLSNNNIICPLWFVSIHFC